MLFKFPKKKITVDCFTAERVPYELFKIDHARKFVPDWWKELPRTINLPNEEGKVMVNPEKTMRSCYGFRQNYQHGLIIPLWTDITIALESKFSKQMLVDCTLNNQYNFHPPHQRGAYLPANDYEHVKLVSPWVINCNKDIKWVFQCPTWNFSHPEELIIPPGIIDYKYQGATNINLFVKYSEEPKSIDLTAGMPMAHIIPLTEEKIVLKHHFVSQEEFARVHSLPTTYLRYDSYDRMRKLFLAKEAEEAAKCPFRNFFK